MYVVTKTGEKFESFAAAVNSARAAESNVVQEDNGVTRWTPAPRPSAAKLREYEGRKNAYEAQKK